MVSEIAAEIGVQSVVVVLDVKQRFIGKSHDVWTHNATRNSKRDLLEVAVEMEKMGAGEIVLNSIDNDGRMTGYDLKLASQLRRVLHIPLTILGGAGSLAHMAEAVAQCGLIGVAAGSLFVFKGSYRAVLISYPGAEEKIEKVYSALKLA